MKFLLQQRRHPKKAWEASDGVTYVNATSPNLGTPLWSAINGRRSHPRVVRMLVDAGANTTSVEALKRDPLDHLRHVLRLEESTEEADGARS